MLFTQRTSSLPISVCFTLLTLTASLATASERPLQSTQRTVEEAPGPQESAFALPSSGFYKWAPHQDSSNVLPLDLPPNSDLALHTKAEDSLPPVKASTDGVSQDNAVRPRTMISRVACNAAQRESLLRLLRTIAIIASAAHRASKRGSLMAVGHSTDRENFLEIFGTLTYETSTKVSSHYAAIYRETSRVDAGTVLIGCEYRRGPCLQEPNLVMDTAPEANFIMTVGPLVSSTFLLLILFSVR